MTMAQDPFVSLSAGGLTPVAHEPELRTLLHRLNNQLGIILANAELLETKLADDGAKSRARQMVSSAVDAIGTVRQIRLKADSL